VQGRKNTAAISKHCPCWPWGEIRLSKNHLHEGGNGTPYVFGSDKRKKTQGRLQDVGSRTHSSARKNTNGLRPVIKNAGGPNKTGSRSGNLRENQTSITEKKQDVLEGPCDHGGKIEHRQAEQPSTRGRDKRFLFRATLLKARGICRHQAAW